MYVCIYTSHRYAHTHTRIFLRISLCHPGWNAVAQTWLTAALTILGQAILLSSQDHRCMTLCPANFFLLLFFFERGSHHIPQADVKFLVTSNLPPWPHKVLGLQALVTMPVLHYIDTYTTFPLSLHLAIDI